jgi:hypothetical protein
MDDIIRQGEDRGPGRGRGRLVLAGVAIVIAAVVVAEHLPHGRPPRAHQPAAQSRSGRAPQLGSGPASSGAPARIAGAAATFPGSVRLPRTGVRPSWFWPATGRTRLIGGLPPDRSGYVFIAMSGGWAIEPAPIASAGCGDCAGLPVPVYFLADRAPSATMVGTANQVAPGATADALWLTTYPPNARLRTAVGTAREVTSTGAPVAPPLRLPAGFQIDQATGRGLLLAQIAAPTRYLLWSPSGVRRAFADVIAASGSAVAWVPQCVVTCLVYVLSLATGHQVVITPPPDSPVVDAAFSPDGRYLALGVSYGFGPMDGELRVRLEVATVATGYLQAVPEAWMNSGARVGFGWPVGRDELVAELSLATKVRVASWRPGAFTCPVVAIKARQDPKDLIVR